MGSDRDPSRWNFISESFAFGSSTRRCFVRALLCDLYWGIILRDDSIMILYCKEVEEDLPRSQTLQEAHCVLGIPRKAGSQDEKWRIGSRLGNLPKIVAGIYVTKFPAVKHGQWCKADRWPKNTSILTNGEELMSNARGWRRPHWLYPISFLHLLSSWLLWAQALRNTRLLMSVL